MEDKGFEPRSVWCPRTWNPLGCCDSLFPASSPPTGEQWFLARALGSHTAQAAQLLCRLSKTPVQETAPLWARDQRRSHPSPGSTKCQSQGSQTLIGETLRLSAKCCYRRHPLHPRSAEGQCETFPYIYPPLHVIGVHRVLQGGAPGWAGEAMGRGCCCCCLREKAATWEWGRLG